MKIQSKFKTYSVDFIESIDSKINELANLEETFFVIDRNVYNLYKNEFDKIQNDKLYLIDAIESKKNINTVFEIYDKLTLLPSKRNTQLVSIGGGIVQDVTGYVASTLYRGIKWAFFPSTLLAACDSCIGGKSSLNYKGFKNLLGSFYPPDCIYIYSKFFTTLTNIDYCSGLGEVVKFNVIAGNNDISKIKVDISSLLDHEYKLPNKYIEKSLTFKKDFIKEDEFDTGLRI